MAPLGVTKLTFTILACIVFAANAAYIPAPPAGYARGVPADWYGNDLDSMCSVPLSKCASLCNSRPACKGFFFRGDVLVGGCCWTKSLLTGYPDAGGVSTSDGSATFAKITVSQPPFGYEAKPAEWVGNDLGQPRYSTPINICMDDCTRSRDCVAFFHAPQFSGCWLKKALPGYPTGGKLTTSGATKDGATFAKVTFAQAPAKRYSRKQADWPGNDLLTTCGVTIAEAATTCNARLDCKGFYWRPADMCATFKSALPFWEFPERGIIVTDLGATFKKMY